MDALKDKRFNKVPHAARHTLHAKGLRREYFSVKRDTWSVKRERGFTLTELIIAVALTSIVALAVTSIDLTSRRFLMSSRNQANAQIEARFAMEHMMRNIREGAVVVTAETDDIRINMPLGWSPTWIRYQRTASNELNYSYQGGGAAETIATGITQLESHESGDALVTLVITAITARDRDEEITLKSTITLRNS